MEILQNTHAVIGEALRDGRFTRSDIAAVGIANQRETTVVWDRATGIPVYNAIVWQDTRTQAIVDRLANGRYDRFRSAVGLPLSTYFSATKVAWILETAAGVRERANRGGLMLGTMDSWLLWNLTGGAQGGTHATDVTNASRTLFLDLRTLAWREDIVAEFGVPMSMLPEVRSSSAAYGFISGDSPLRGVPITGILGDQQAAALGQLAFDAGDAKNTYGTGNFLMVGTGENLVLSDHGLITTVAYSATEQPPRYALEGSVAVAGALIQWLRDKVGLVSSADEVEDLARQVPDNGGAFIVPAFSGLFTPYWRPDARGAIVGLTSFVTKAHIARAALEAIAYQTRDVLDAATADTGVALTELRVDGGAAVNDFLLQFQADILGIPVIRPASTESTALGAAYAAGLGAGVWSGIDELRGLHRGSRTFSPEMAPIERQRLYGTWRKAVTRTFDWAELELGT